MCILCRIGSVMSSLYLPIVHNYVHYVHANVHGARSASQEFPLGQSPGYGCLSGAIGILMLRLAVHGSAVIRLRVMA